MATRLSDPLNAAPISADPLIADPLTDPRLAATDPNARIVNRVDARRGGSGVLIAAVILVLAVVAYMIFAPGSSDTATVPAGTTTNEMAPAANVDSPAAPANTAPATTAAPAASGTEAPAATGTAPATTTAPAQ